MIFSCGDLKDEIYMILDDLFQTECFRTSVCNCQHINTESIFQTSLLVQHIGQVFHIGIFFQFKHDTDAFFGRLVWNIYNVGRLLCLDKRCHVIEELADVCSEHGIRNLGNNKLLFAAFEFLYFYFSSQTDLTASCLVNLTQIIFIYYNTASRKIRSFDITHQTSYADGIIFHISLDRIDHLTEVVRRNTGRHTNRDTISTIDKNIRNTNRKHGWFFLRLIKVRHKIHYVFIEITQKNFLRELFQTRFGISHGRCSVTFDRTKVSMSVYQRPALLEILRHHNQRIINGTVTMRMIFTHGITDNTGAFTIWAVITDPQFIHIIKCSSLNRFQTISHIRKCTWNNDTHRIINIGFLHNFRIIGTNYIFLFCFHIILPPYTSSSASAACS